MNLQVTDLKPFVPARDFDLSKQFYLDLGFSQNWGYEDAAEFQIGDCSFILQNFYNKEAAENSMMSLAVENQDDWWRHLNEMKLNEKYQGIMMKPPALQPWGLKVLYLSDPSGVLWHIIENQDN